MPCTDGGPTIPYSVTIRDNANEIAKLRKKLDKYANMLCFVCSYIDTNAWKTLASHATCEEHPNAFVDLEEWWAEHQRIDEARIAKERLERLRANALKKLTKEERDVLNIK